MTTVEFIKAIITTQHGWAVADQFESTFENPSPTNFNEQNEEALNLIKETIEDLFDSNLLSEELINVLDYYLECMEGVDEEEYSDDFDNELDDDFEDYDYNKGLFDVD